MVNGRHYAIIPMDEYNEFIEWKKENDERQKEHEEYMRKLGDANIEDIPF